jgi:uncharacterized membrane protein (DUF485 family)
MSHENLRDVAARRGRIAALLTVGTMVVYFGFILLVAWGKPFLATRVHPGLSIGILLGSFVIVASWAMTGLYVWWANRHYDTAVRRLSEKSNGEPS